MYARKHADATMGRKIASLAAVKHIFRICALVLPPHLGQHSRSPFDFMVSINLQSLCFLADPCTNTEARPLLLQARAGAAVIYAHRSRIDLLFEIPHRTAERIDVPSSSATIFAVRQSCPLTRSAVSAISSFVNLFLEAIFNASPRLSASHDAHYPMCIIYYT